MRRLVILVLLTFSMGVGAAPPTVDTVDTVPVAQLTPPPPPPAAEVREPAGPSLDHFGLQLEAGVPSGVSAALVVRPWKLLRFHAGASWNYIGFGLKGGVTLVPFHWAVVPTLGIEGGIYPGANASRLVKGTLEKTLLKDVSYSYVDADLGLEFGSQNGFIFFVRGGMSYLKAPIKNVASAFQSTNLGVVGADDAVATYFGPSAKFGFLLYLY
jgi:hypothetical protein